MKSCKEKLENLIANINQFNQEKNLGFLHFRVCYLCFISANLVAQKMSGYKFNFRYVQNKLCQRCSMLCRSLMKSPPFSTKERK